MFQLIRSLRRNRRLLKDFVVRDLKARYVGSSMGFFWSVVFPIINLFVYMFVFRLILKARWSDHQGPLEVALVMLAGIVVWAAFAETVSRSTNTLVDNSNLIQKVVFPSELLPFYLAVSSLINMCIGMPVVILCVVWFAYISPPEVNLYIPVGGDPLVAQKTVVRERHLADREQHPTAFRVPIQQSRGLSRDVVIPIELSGTAVEGVDYRMDIREVTIPAGHIRVDLQFQPLPDDEVEEDETIIIRLLEPDGAALIRRGSAGPEASRARTIHLRNSEPLAGGELPEPVPAWVPEPAKDARVPYYPLALGLSIVCLPLLFGLQIVFTVGIGYLLATLNIFMRDTFHLVGVGLTVWMFSTPIFYPGALVEKAEWGILLKINPMHWLIESYRAVLLYANWPDPMMVARFAVAALVSFTLGGAFFMAQKQKFPDLL